MLGATPAIALRAGESKVPYGKCRSAGYWCVEYRAEPPNRPDSVILWAEDFVGQREAQFRQLVGAGCDVNVYVGIHCFILALGFDLPATPLLWKLGIPISIEFFSA